MHRAIRANSLTENCRVNVFGKKATKYFPKYQTRLVRSLFMTHIFSLQTPPACGSMLYLTFRPRSSNSVSDKMLFWQITLASSSESVVINIQHPQNSAAKMLKDTHKLFFQPSCEWMYWSIPPTYYSHSIAGSCASVCCCSDLFTTTHTFHSQDALSSPSFGIKELAEP